MQIAWNIATEILQGSAVAAIILLILFVAIGISKAYWWFWQDYLSDAARQNFQLSGSFILLLLVLFALGLVCWD